MEPRTVNFLTLASHNGRQHRERTSQQRRAPHFVRRPAARAPCKCTCPAAKAYEPRERRALLLVRNLMFLKAISPRARTAPAWENLGAAGRRDVFSLRFGGISRPRPVRRWACAALRGQSLRGLPGRAAADHRCQGTRVDGIRMGPAACSLNKTVSIRQRRDPCSG